MNNIINKILEQCGIIGIWIAVIAFIIMLFVSMIIAIWSWAIVGIIILSFFVSVLARVAGEEKWFNLKL